MEVRKIRESDLPELTRLMVAVYNAPPWNNQWTEETASESLATLLSFPTFYGNVIVDDQKIFGAIMGHLRKYSSETTYYIDELFVAIEHRRQGVAKCLYERTITDLQQMGVQGAFFTSLRDTPAYHFYIKLGAWDLTDSACFYHKF